METNFLSNSLDEKPLKKLVMEDVSCLVRGDIHSIKFYNSRNNKCIDGLIIERKDMICGDLDNEIDLHNCTEEVDVRRALSDAHIYLEELILSEFCSLTIMPNVGDWCKNLTKLEFVCDTELYKTQVDLHVYIKAFAHLGKLLSIKIKVINGKTNLFPTEIINHFPKKLNEIHLSFEQSSQQTQPLFFSLEKFQDLYRLTMRYCNLDNMIEDISKKSTLDHLDIRGSWVENKSWPVFNRLVNLKHIDLPAIAYNSNILRDGAKSVNSAVVGSIFNTCKYLEYFDMSPHTLDRSEPNISPENWVNLGNLVHFGIGWEISDAFATKMVEYCQNLKYLDCKIINHVNVIIIIKKLTQLQNLECLKLHDWIFYSAETITAISNNCKKLKRLEIVCSGMNYVNGVADAHIFNELSKLQYLEYLDLSRLKIDTSTNKIHVCTPYSMYNNVQLQDINIKLIADNCKNLKYLNIGGCKSLTENAFNSLTKLENLKELTVDHNTAVTNNFIGKLKGLKFFSCVGCSKLAEASEYASPYYGIIQLIENCPYLEQLVLGSIDNNKALKKIITAADSVIKNRSNSTILKLYIQILQKVFKSLEIKINSRYLLIINQ